MRLPPYDSRASFDDRLIWALRMVGVNLKEHIWSKGRLKNQCIRFTFIGDREMAKGVITDMICDEYNGNNCRFYAENNDPRCCYVLFDERQVITNVQS